MVTQVATGGAVEVGSLGRAEEGLVSTGQMDLGVGKTGDSPQASGKSVEPLVTPASSGGRKWSFTEVLRQAWVCAAEGRWRPIPFPDCGPTARSVPGATPLP